MFPLNPEQLITEARAAGYTDEDMAIGVARIAILHLDILTRQIMALKDNS